MNTFYILNGEIEKLESLTKQGFDVFAIRNTVHETIRLYDTKPLFLAEHLDHIRNTLQILQIAPPTYFDNQRISRYITRLLNVNKVYKGGICTIVVFVNNNQTQCAIFIESLKELDFTYNLDGYKLGIESSLSIGPPYFQSECSTHNLVPQIAKTIISKNDFDAVCYFSIQNSIIHSSEGDIFYCSEDVFHIISSNKNHLRNPLTDFLISELKKKGYKIKETTVCSENDLLRADEIFLVNHISGIRWVSRINDTFFGFKHSKKIFHLLVKNIEQLSKSI